MTPNGRGRLRASLVIQTQLANIHHDVVLFVGPLDQDVSNTCQETP
jgi:hypothetical protein